MCHDRYDVVVAGAGVVGAALAMELSHYRLRVLLVESKHDVGEGTISNVTITLYLDNNGDGIGDTVWATTNSDAIGDFLFTGLPDGDYVVEAPFDLPATNYDGWVNSTFLSISILGLAGGVTNSGNDFGYIPALQLTKTAPSDPLKTDNSRLRVSPPGTA